MDRVRIPQHCRLFSGLTVISTVNITGALSDPVPIYIVVQHWLLAINHDCITNWFVVESPSMQ